MKVLVSLIPIIISCAAFAFSVLTWRERKFQDRRDLFLKINERLIDVELQRGRRILYQVRSVDDAASLLRNRPEDYDSANRALAMLDTAALYVERGYVDNELFMQEWGYVYAAILENSRNFMTERIARNAAPGSAAWSHFLRLAARAVERELPNQTTRQNSADDRPSVFPLTLPDYDETSEPEIGQS